VWSPAGDQLALSIGRYFRSPGAPAAQLALVKPDGSDFQVILDDGKNNGFPSWSPDGKRLVFKSGHQLAILSLADRKVTPLTDGSHEDNLPQWCPISDTILYTSDRDGQFDLYTIRPDGSQVRRLTTTSGQNAHAVWSPDCQWIVFSSGRMGFKDEMALYDAIPQPNGEIFIMRADGSGARQLTDNKWEDGSPGWMPDAGHR
jgi:Tol biopolymer transport system component